MFVDRTDAGRLLAVRLERYRDRQPVVLGLPRGGVAVAAAVAAALGATLDAIVSCKIGYPGSPELAIGAVTARGTRVLYDELLRQAFVPPGYLEKATEAAHSLARRREDELRAERPAEPLAGRTVILVDDGIATGMTMLAAIADVRAQKPAWVVVATPIVAPTSLVRLCKAADDCVYLDAPVDFFKIGQVYEDFSQVSDDDVKRLLSGHGPRLAAKTR